MEIETEVEPRPLALPTWYWVVAVLCLLFELAGCYAYVQQVTIDPATLPIDQRALVEVTPFWVMGAYAVAVFVGLVGALGLLLKKRFAQGALFLSMCAVIVQFGGMLLLPEVRGAMSSSQLLGPILIFVLAYAYWTFAKTAAKRGWLS